MQIIAVGITAAFGQKQSSLTLFSGGQAPLTGHAKK